MLPSARGGLAPPLHFWVLVLFCLTGVAATSASSTRAAEAAAPRWWAYAAAGPAHLSDLPPGASLAVLGIRSGVSLPGRWGLSARLRMDAPLLNDVGSALSMRLDGGHADFGLTLRMAPSVLPVGLEYHHLAGNATSSLGLLFPEGGAGYLFESGASHFFDLSQRGRHHRLRLGYGSMGLDANLAPTLLGLHGFLPSHRGAVGPFATLTAERLRLGGFVGRAGVLVMFHTGAHQVARGNYLAWGATMHRALSRRLILGASYMGGNSSLPGHRPPSMVSLYLRLRFSRHPR